MKKLLLILIFAMSSFWMEAQTRIPVNVAELKKEIMEDLARSNAGSIVKGAFMVVTNNVTTYEVTINKSKSNYTLIYDKNGKFLKKQVILSPVIEKKIYPKKKKLIPEVKEIQDTTSAR
jgi:hypothetical protein